MEHVVVSVAAPPCALPRERWRAAAFSALLHATAACVLVLLGPASGRSPVGPATRPAIASSAVDTRHIVFVASDPRAALGRGGGGGGNRQPAPIRHAQSIGSDAITLRIAKPVSTSGRTPDAAVLPGLLLDARPLASGNVEQLGLPVGGVPFGTSQGPGSGGGVGEGEGTGIGSGRGAGLGPGSGGGTGGGLYRPGGAVTTPRVLIQVKPTYTTRALHERIQGTVVLELVVRANGVPSDIQIVRSLDPGLDEEAITAVREWRFEPGRFAGKPVDVLVRVLLDFSIR